jgi:putative intracellular protease/amidase
MSLSDPNPSNKSKPKRVAIVIANPATSSTTGWPVGFWWSELTHPYYAFHEAGYEVEVVQPRRRQVRGRRDERPSRRERLLRVGPHQHGLHPHAEPRRARRENEAGLGDQRRALRRDRRRGRPGADVQLRGATDLHKKFVEFYEAGKIACALCHGVALLRYAKLSNGEPLAKGKTVTGFANVEEDFADNAVWGMGALPRDKHLMPWRIEDELEKLGANFVQAGCGAASRSATAT